MTTPTVPVTVTLTSIGGPAKAGITVTAKLDRNEVHEGIVISDKVEGVTDANGVVVLNCFPNAPDPAGLGTMGSTYRFTAKIPNGRELNARARVPNEACRLESILVLDSGIGLDEAQLALSQVQGLVTTVQGLADAASGSAEEAAESAQQAMEGKEAIDQFVAEFGTLTGAIEAVQEVGAEVAQDKEATAADRVQTGLDVVAAAAEKAGAELAKTGAEDARDDALDAVIAAAVANGSYGTKALGRAAVSNGQPFTVRPNVTDGLTRFTVYIRVDASNETFVADSVNGYEFDYVAGRDTGIANAVMVGHDTDGERAFEMDEDGAFAVRDVLFGNARSLAETAAEVDALTQASKDAIGDMSYYIDKMYARTDPGYVAQSNVFDAAVDTDRPNYRLPVPVRISATEYLLFANAQGDTTDTAQTDIVMRKVTLAADGTPTLGTIITLAEGGPDDGTGKAFQYNNVTALRTSSGKIVCWYTYRNSDARVHVPYMRTCPAGSDPTNIANWTAQEDMSAVFPMLALEYDPVTYPSTPVGYASNAVWNAIIFGPAKGIEIQHGDHAGRLVIPYWRSDPSYNSGGNTNGLYCGFVLSDDDGETWELGAESWLSRGNESAVAEEWRTGEVLLLSRRENFAGKWISRSRDGGEHIHEWYRLDQDTINAPVCEHGFTQAANAFDGSTPKLVMTGPRPSTAATNTTGQGRERPTIFLSYDGGRTFPHRYQIGTGYCGYSVVEPFGDDGFAVFWESDSSRQKISIKVVSLHDILGA
jgi:hypothetical protein